MSISLGHLKKRLEKISDKDKSFLDRIVREIVKESNGKVCGTCLYKQGVFCICNYNIDDSGFVRVYSNDAIACKRYVEKE